MVVFVVFVAPLAVVKKKIALGIQLERPKNVRRMLFGSRGKEATAEAGCQPLFLVGWFASNTTSSSSSIMTRSDTRSVIAGAIAELGIGRKGTATGTVAVAHGRLVLG